MDSSKAYVSLSATQGNSLSFHPQQQLTVLSSSGSLPIRAPLTLDSDSEIDELGSVATTCSNVSVDFESGEDLETASERPSLADTGDESESGSFVSFDTDEYGALVEKVMVGDTSLVGVRPIAQLSWESEDIEQVVSEEIEGGEMLSHVKVLSSAFAEGISTPPRVKLSEVEEGEEYMNKFVESRNGDAAHVECIEDCGLAIAETNSDDMDFDVSEEGEKVESMEEESFEKDVDISERFNELEGLGVEGNENQIMDLTTYSQPNIILEEAEYLGKVMEDKVENRSPYNLITLSSLMDENVTTGLKTEDPVANQRGLVLVGDVGVQFQGNKAKVETPLKEKDSTTEQDKTSSDLFVESVTPGIKAVEVVVEQEQQSAMGKDCSIVKQSEPAVEVMDVENSDLSEIVTCLTELLKLITPSFNVNNKCSFGGEMKIRKCKVGSRSTGVAVTHFDEDVATGLKIEDQIVARKGMVLAGSAGAVQCHDNTAYGAKLEVCLNQKDVLIKQEQTSFGLSLMKWGGGLVLAADMLSQFSVGNSNIAIHVVLDNKQRGKIAIRTNNSEKLQSAGIIGFLSIAATVFSFFGSRFSGQF